MKDQFLKCTYCGSPWGDTLDHVVSKLSQGWGRNTPNIWGHDKVVPACNDCNATLSTNHLNTISTRAAYLAGRLGQRYRKLIRTTAQWSEDELAELGPGLRQTISRATTAATEASARIAHCTLVADLDPSIAEVWATHGE